MDNKITEMHIKAGLKCGKERTYPCAFCGGWHIGRKMTTDELTRLSKID